MLFRSVLHSHNLFNSVNFLHMLRSGIKLGFWESDLSFRVGVFADRGMLPGLARTIALTTIVVQLRLN